MHLKSLVVLCKLHQRKTLYHFFNVKRYCSFGQQIYANKLSLPTSASD